ncbi:MAG TPA: hypothetical protein VJY35_16335 [Candidatus Eisenbacteria bacterium]|nr:hypothetical protein [Candidatus Eisenbacteria bacterium]
MRFSTRGSLAALLVVAALAALAAGSLSGCDGNGIVAFRLRDRLASQPPPPPPIPNSPANTLRLLEWALERRSISHYQRLFTEDYLFTFTSLDSAGSEWRDSPWTRDDELNWAMKLFRYTTRIDFQLDRNFVVHPDPATPWDTRRRWHASIRTQYVFMIERSDGFMDEFTGPTTFTLVRGDSAVIPADLVARGVRPDSTRWYIRRWDDESGLVGGFKRLWP